MADLLIAIVGDINKTRTLDPLSKAPDMAATAAEKLGAELAKQGARLLVYGGPFLEADVVRGFVKAKPKHDNSINKWFTIGNEPTPFVEESTHPKLFKRTIQSGTDWKVAFYRSITQADGVILMGGADATLITGQIALGSKMPILTFQQFGGGAAKVWDTLSAGDDLPTREEIALMAETWNEDSASKSIKALFSQFERKQSQSVGINPLLTIIAGGLFTLALAIVPLVFGRNEFSIWMLFLVPLIAGGAGAGVRQIVDRKRLLNTSAAVLAPITLGFVAGGIAGVLFVTAQLTGNPKLSLKTEIVEYATRSIPYALAVGFVSGMTSDSVFTKLLGLDVIKTTSLAVIDNKK